MYADVLGRCRAHVSPFNWAKVAEGLSVPSGQIAGIHLPPDHTGICAFPRFTTEEGAFNNGKYSFRKTNSEFLIWLYRDDPCNAYSDGAPV